MGRLYKAKVDSIRELLKQGYLQKEVAEKLGVHVRTVRKYDPSSMPSTSHSGSTVSVLDLVRDTIAWILDYMDFIESSLQLDKIRNGRCPRCSEKKFEFDAIRLIYSYANCGYSLVSPSDICRNCFTQNPYDEDNDQDPFKCKECGHKIH